MITTKEFIDLLDEKCGKKKEHTEKESGDSKGKKYSVKVPGKDDVPADSLDAALKVIEPVAKKASVEVVHNASGKKVAYGPKPIAKAVMLAKKKKGEK